MINQFYIDYIKAIENPNRVGWNGKVWTAPQYKGYDKNQRGYGIDIVKNDSAKRLTQNRPGQWLTEGEADKLMREHLLYVYGAAQKHIEGFDNLSDRRKAALLGMLYRGDSVNKNRHIININEPDDNKFFESISNYYKSKGLNERAKNSSNFFNNQTNFLIPMKWEQWEPPMKFKSGGQIRKMQTAAGGPIKKPIKRLKDGYRYIPDEENGGWDRISDNSMSDVFATMEFTPKKTKVGSSITRTLQPKTSNYRSAYNPDDIIKGFNILTLGGLNNLSPTLWARRVYDTGKLLTGNMTWSGYTNSWINDNNGLVSLKFSKEHPYLSAGINLVGDAAALGGISGIKKLTNISKPNVSVTANIGTTAEQGTTALSLEEILKAFEAARQWHLNRINSPGYKNRALRAGFTEEEIPQLLQQLTSLINRLKLLRPEEVLGSNIRLNHNLNGKLSAGYWRTNLNGNLKQGISFYDTNASYDDAVSNFIHEFGHGATFGLNGTETSGYMKALADQFPLINRAVKYNRSLYPEVTEETVRKVLPSAAKTGNLGYYALPTEMLSRGYEFMRDYGNNWWKLKNSGNSFTGLDVMNNAANSRFNSKLFRGLTGNSGAYNFQKNALGISAPLGLGYGLYNNDNLQQLQYLKQGGKMNILKLFKSGGLIRKMLTASGGPLRIKFTPEQIALFESQATRVPGMKVNSNSTVGEAAKKAGEASVRQTNRRNAEKAEEFNKRNEMRSRVPVGERSGEVIYETKETGPKVIGMSGRDPLLGTLFDLYVGGKGLSAIGKTAKYYFKNSKALKGFNYNDLPAEKYTYNDKTGDWNIEAPKKEWVKIGENDLVPDYFQSRAEYDRLIASGASPEEAAEIMETRYLNVINARPGIFRNLGRWPYGESRVENGIILPVYNSRKHVQGSLNDAKTTLNTVFHELGGHGSSMNVQYGVPLEGVSDDFALRLFKILEHNEKLRPKLRPFFLAVKDGNILKAKELIPKDGSYLKGMNGEIDVKRILDWIKYMEENLEYSARAIGSNMSNHYGMPNGFNEKQLREVFTDESVDNLLKNVWNYGVPVTTGGYTLYNLFNQPLQQLQYQKQGGKMNILEFLKNGSGIHIKEKNKGKFTSYCGGKVTDECILKGKNSSNPAIRKRATFAANARKWKHKEGGVIKAATGTQVNTDTTSKKFNWNSALSTGVDFIGQMLPSIIGGGGNSSSLQIPDTSNAMTDTTLLYLLLLQQQAQAISDLDTVLKSQYDYLNPNANGGDIVRKHYNWLLTSAKKGLDAEAEKKKKDLIDTLVANLKANTIGSLLLTGLGLVSNYIGNKKGSSVS